MKKKIFIALISIFFIACSNQHVSINELWEEEKKIDYFNYKYEDQLKIEELMNSFSREEKFDKKNWECGYSQQCYILRKLYFNDLISEEDFLSKCEDIYKRYVSASKKLDIHLFGYAVCLYYSGSKELSCDLLNKILNEADLDDFDSDYEFEMIKEIATELITSKSNYINEYSDFDINKEDLLSTFCGN